jgi:hypothetical protein
MGNGFGGNNNSESIQAQLNYGNDVEKLSDYYI